MDLLFVTHNRLEFTKAALTVLVENTKWDEVSKVFLYDDQSTDGTKEYLQRCKFPVEHELCAGKFRGPVNIMVDYLSRYAPTQDGLFAKIDSDTMVPPGWLEDCLSVMHRHPRLGLLGIEAMTGVSVPVQKGLRRDYEEAEFIGGIGLMRRREFANSVPRARADGRFGFTEWQMASTHVVKGWIKPALPVFLLDHLPREPWVSLSKEYVQKGWQRVQWGTYEEHAKHLWSWWCE